MTETLPLPATALLPVVLFPWLGVLGSKDVCINYLKDTNFLFFGGLIIAVAVERWNLHKRIALRVLLLVGSKPQWLMFGFMLTTAFLSMWLSNTATTAMLVPIAHAVTEEMRKQRQFVAEVEDRNYEQPIHAYDNNIELQEETKPQTNTQGGQQSDGYTDNTKQEPDLQKYQGYTEETSEVATIPQSRSPDQMSDAEFNKLTKGMKLCIAYAANIGGTSTLTGTGPNLVFKSIADRLYGDDHGMNFSSWFLFSFPNMVMCLFLSWIWMILFFIGPRRLFCGRRGKTDEEKGATKVIRDSYNKLGPICFAEVSVALVFTLVVILWLTRQPAFMPGWGQLPFLEKGYVTDACVGVTVAMLLFMLPARKPSLCDTRSVGPVPALIDWQAMQKYFAWGVIILIGGSFAMADACQKSGLSNDIGSLFQHLFAMPPWLLAVLFCVLTSACTEFGSNVATATIFLPIVAKLAEGYHIHPFYLMFSVTIAASFSFMFPVATAPNAIAFSYGDIKMLDMVTAGAVLNVLCISVLQLSINTLGYKMFDLGEYPTWAGGLGNVTIYSNRTHSL